MVIDDQYDIVYVVRRHLEKWGHAVDTFVNPLIALRAFKENPDRYSIVITDIRMPEMSGVVLAKKMQEIKPNTKIIIMTAFELYASDLMHSVPAIENDDVLRKPIKIDQVCATVKKHLKDS